MFTVKIHKVTEIEKMTEFVRDAEKRKKLHLGSNVTLYVQKRYAIIYLSLRIVVKCTKIREKVCKINEN